MPTYTFHNENDNKEFDIELRMSELDEYKKTNPHLRQVYKPLTIIGGVGDIGRHSDEGWKDTLKSIKKASGRGNKINV